MEGEWLGDLCRTLDIEAASLLLIWDADLLFGPKPPFWRGSGCVLRDQCQLRLSIPGFSASDPGTANDRVVVTRRTIESGKPIAHDV
jgi:hypothetical protein